MDKRTEREERAKRLKRARGVAGFASATAAARAFKWKVETYKAHENGRNGFDNDAGREYARAYKVDLAWLMTGEGSDEVPIEKRSTAPVMGRVGAGNEIEVEFEQEEGADTVELPFSLPADMIAFVVDGESMLPVFEPGQVIVCYREQHRPTENFLGRRAVVKTADGMRFLKTVVRGSRRGLFNLESWNAKTIEDVRIEWIGEIVASIAPSAVRFMERAVRRRLPRVAAGRPHAPARRK